MPATKRNSLEHEERLERIGKLHRAGLSQPKIAEKVGISQPAVNKALAVIRKRYKKEIIEDRHSMVVQQSLQLRELMSRAMGGWNRSRMDAVTVAVEELTGEYDCPVCFGEGKNKKGNDCVRCKGKGIVEGKKKITTTTKSQAGDPRFLVVMQDTMKSFRDLFGLDAPKKAQVASVQLPWEEFIKDIPDEPPIDLIEQQIEAAGIIDIGEQPANLFQELHDGTIPQETNGVYHEEEPQ